MPTSTAMVAIMRHVISLFIFGTLLIVPRALADDAPAIREPAIKTAERNHWAFQQPRRQNIPKVRRADWIRTRVDAFILAKLEEKDLLPSVEADRVTLLRRITFDLTGLPPTPEEQDSFLADSRPDAYERVVERLLNSAHYGERWALHWLDVVRFAESDGYEADSERPHAWRYRDYVVQSFNSDKPYDQFVVEQIAGDRLPNAGPDAWIAAGVHRCGPIHLVGGNTDPEFNRQEVLNEMVSGFGAAFLGLTLACARCHDHKFDPISQADYYRSQAFFTGTRYRERALAPLAERIQYAAAVAAIEAKTKPLKDKVAALEAPYRAKILDAKKTQLEPKYRAALAIAAEKRTPEQKKLVEHANILLMITWDEVVGALTAADRAKRRAWRDEIHAREAHLPPPPAHAWSVADDAKPPATHILRRGDVKKKDAVVQAAFPRVLNSASPDQTRPQELTRLELARWLARPDHPLTARVWVNRVWQYHFGRGLVATPNDFGLRGEKPTHPELLDWLATEFVQQGWSTKWLHRTLVLSATYRQSSKLPSEHNHSALDTPLSALKLDPDNRLMWRMNRQRLEGEALRDAMLAAAGTLNRVIGGPKVRVPLEREIYDLIFTESEPDGLWKSTPDETLHTRRTLYLFAKRNVRQPLLEAFDQPDALNSCPLRPVSTFAPQALILMNGPLAQEQSKAFAVRMLREAGGKPEAIIARAWRLALARPPRPDEGAAARQFLDEQVQLLRDRLLARHAVGIPPGTPSGIDPALAAAVADLCLALLNLNEFVYID